MMVRDFLTKPLNGTRFKNHRNTIIGLDKDTIEYYKMKYKMVESDIKNVLEVEEMVHPNQSFKY